MGPDAYLQATGSGAELRAAWCVAFISRRSNNQVCSFSSYVD